MLSHPDNAEIDPNDSVLESMTATLTRNQSATVRKRIKSLNETWKRKRTESHSTPRHADVRTLFPVQQVDGPPSTSSRSHQVDGPPSTSPRAQHVDGPLSTSSRAQHVDGPPSISPRAQHLDAQQSSFSTQASVVKHNGIHSTEYHRAEKHSTTSSRGTPGLLIDSCFYNESQEQTRKLSSQGQNHNPAPDTEQDISSYRQAIDKNMNMLYSSPKKLSRSPQPVHTQRMRPPPPRRAKSEGLCKIQSTTLLPHGSPGKLCKSPSEGSPVHCEGKLFTCGI